MKTENTLVLTVFGSERCVTTLGDLEAAVMAIYSKAVRGAKTAAQSSTFGAEIDGQIRLLNAESDPSKTKAPRP